MGRRKRTELIIFVCLSVQQYSTSIFDHETFYYHIIDITVRLALTTWFLKPSFFSFY